MGRRRRGVPFAQGQKFCIFCGGTGLSKTHIWPKWLNQLLAPEPRHTSVREPPRRFRQLSEVRVAQGSLFTQKPYLACESCNTGWMADFEDAMKKFAPPLFVSSATEMRLTVAQQRTLAGWIALITILAEYMDKSKRSLSIPKRDRDYLKRHLTPPPEWAIFCSTLEGREWSSKYRHRTTHMAVYESEAEYWGKGRSFVQPNTQVSSFGLGKLFFQIFTAPFPAYVADYRRCCIETKLSQVWPIRTSIFASRTVKFPTDLILTDETADILSDSYANRIREMSGKFGT